MRLPNADQAVVDITKLRDYSLNPLHPEGKHKARVLAASLGFTAADAAKLCALVLGAVLLTTQVSAVLMNTATDIR